MLNALSRVANSFSSDSKDKHEDNHPPKLHGGLVIKQNANQRYATNAVTSFIFKEIASKHNLPIQDFVVRNDMPCGSMIGPILASGVGICTVDAGASQLSMHSIREMCAADDVKHSYEHFMAFSKTSLILMQRLPSTYSNMEVKMLLLQVGLSVNEVRVDSTAILQG